MNQSVIGTCGVSRASVTHVHDRRPVAYLGIPRYMFRVIHGRPFPCDKPPFPCLVDRRWKAPNA